MTSASDEKWRLSIVFSVQGTGGRRDKFWRTRWVIKSLEVQIDQFLRGCMFNCNELGHCRARTKTLGDIPAAFSFQNVLHLHQQR